MPDVNLQYALSPQSTSNFTKIITIHPQMDAAEACPNTNAMTHACPPHPALTPYVSTYLVVSNFFETEVQTVFSARGIPMLVFPFKAPSRTTYANGLHFMSYPRPEMDAPALLHASSVPAQSTFAGEVHFVMVMLQPTGAYHFVQHSVSGQADRIELLDSLGLSPCFDELQDRLWQAATPKAAIGLVDYFLCRYFTQKAKVGLNDFSPVIRYMLRKPAQLTVGSLTQKFRCSERWLEKQCNAQTGLAPKTWLRLIRFREASNHWLRHPGTSWMELVARFGYTDQSHLIRDFKAFTGNPPAVYFARYGATETGFQQDKLGLSGLL
jgi:AraC-like DNA-binding protein